MSPLRASSMRWRCSVLAPRGAGSRA